MGRHVDPYREQSDFYDLPKRDYKRELREAAAGYETATRVR